MPLCKAIPPRLPFFLGADSQQTPPLHHLASSVTHYMRAGLPSSTLKSYDSAWLKYNRFCAFHKVPAIPVLISTVASFLIFCFNFCHLLPSSIHGIVASIQFHARCFNPYLPGFMDSTSFWIHRLS